MLESTRDLRATLVFTKVGGEMMQRRMIVKGQFHQVDCGVREDGSTPAGVFLDALKKGTWDRHNESGHLDEQISDYHWFLNAIAHWANTGEPVYRGAVNALEDGVWEFRHGDKRLTFYDTDGTGVYTAKLPISSHAQSEAPGSEHWQIPYFDQQIRLGHAFTKVSQKTLARDLHESRDTREEDLAHDRPIR